MTPLCHHPSFSTYTSLCFSLCPSEPSLAHADSIAAADSFYFLPLSLSFYSLSPSLSHSALSTFFPLTYLAANRQAASQRLTVTTAARKRLKSMTARTKLKLMQQKHIVTLPEDRQTEIDRDADCLLPFSGQKVQQQQQQNVLPILVMRCFFSEPDKTRLHSAVESCRMQSLSRCTNSDSSSKG